MWMLIATVLILLSYFLYIDIRKPKAFPKGPRWYPLIGNYTHFTQKLSQLGYYHLVWKEFAHEYGNLTGLKIGKNLVVAVNGPEMVREVLSRQEFTGRPDGFFFRLRTFGKQIGVIFSEGEFWETQRKFTLFHLKNFGLGKQEMEAVIHEEATDLVKLLREESGRGAVELKYAFDVSVLNTLWAMAAGKRYDIQDARLRLLVQMVHEAFTVVDASGGILNQMPFLRFIAPELSGFNLITNVLNKIIGFIRETIVEHKGSFDGDSPRDLIDMFLIKMKNEDDTFTEEQLISLCLDLFMAGAETTSNTLAFAVLYLAEYPEVQRKMQLELREVVGTRIPTMKDKLMLPYTNAVLCEIQRMANVAPVGVPHKTTCETMLADYVIPKNTLVLTNLFSVHMDVQFWGDPLNFRPERFLNADGRLEIPEKHFLPFGYGKRRCLGESLAKANYFIVIAALLQHFEIGKDPNGPELDLNGRDGFTLTPQSAKLMLKAR